MLRVSLQKLQQENGMLLMIKITQIMVNEIKVLQPLNLKPQLLNQIVVITLTGDITATDGNANTKVAFKNCAPFTKFIANINDEHTDGAENLDIIMPMYNLIEYRDIYSDTSGSFWQFKRDESPVTNAGNPVNVSAANSTSFKYKSIFLKPLEAADNGVFKNLKIAFPLKYLSNFQISLEMPLISFKIHLELDWTKDCIMVTIVDTIFKITNTKLYVIKQRQCKTGKTIGRRI